MTLISREMLSRLLDMYSDKRVLVIGPSCCGKTTLLQSFPHCRDMDDEIFNFLTKEDEEYVNQTWSPAIGEFMTQKCREHLQPIQPGTPLFGTVILDCDIIIYLNIGRRQHEEHCRKRGANFQEASEMKNWIEATILASPADFHQIDF